MRTIAWKTHLLAVALVVVALVVGSRSAARIAGGTFDETIYLSLGRELVQSHNWDPLAALGVAPLPVRLLWNRAVIEPLNAPAGDPAAYRERIMRARERALWLAGVPLMLVVYAWIAATHGAAAGFVGAALLALSPNVLAHVSVATTDVAFTLSFVVTLVALTYNLRRQSFASSAVLSAALGLSLATKYSALALFVSTIILFVIYRRQRRQLPDLSTLAGALFVAWAAHNFALAPVIADGGLATLWINRLLGWTGQSAVVSDWLGELPVPIYLRGIAAQFYLDRAGQEAFLFGQTSQHGWWYFFPVALAIKSTPVELFAFAAFTIVAVRRRRQDVESRVLLVLAGVLAVLAVGSHRALGVRYLLPLLVVAVAGASGWLAEAWRHRPRLASCVAGSALTLQLLSSVSIAPNYLAYFNDFSGGPSNGYTKLIDSNLDWGQDLPQLAVWLQGRGTDRVLLEYFGTAPPAAYGLRATTLRAPAVEEPEPEWFAVSVTLLQGVFVCGDPFFGLRSIEPEARIGYTIMVYSTRDAAVRKVLAAARHDACVQ